MNKGQLLNMVSISTLKKTQHNIVQTIVYVGYFAGVTLLLESLGKILHNQDSSTIIILTNASILWFFSFMMRKVIFNSQVYRHGFRSFLRTEVLYFVLCFAFVSIFLTTMVKYLPFGIPYEKELASSSELLNYVTKDLAFYFMVHFTLISGLILFVSLFSKYIFVAMMGKNDKYDPNQKKMSITRVLTFSFIFLLFLSVFTTVTQLAFVSNLSTWGQNALGIFLSEHLQWLVDYSFGLPSVYYVYASFKGSDIVNNFLSSGSTLS